MVTNDDSYKIILQFLRKDRRDKILAEIEFNRELKRMNIVYMDNILPKYEIDQGITDYSKISLGYDIERKRMTLGVYISLGKLNRRDHDLETRYF